MNETTVETAVEAAVDGAHFRAGFAALVGRPNVGKSTLLNALVGEKISIVTPRPQTTRHRITGLVNRPGVQLAFVDTPGLHDGGKRALNRAMNRAAAGALIDADVVVFVVEALRWGPEDEAVMQRIRDSGRPAIAVVSKVDTARPRERLLPFIEALAARHAFRAIVPVSATRRDNLEPLISAITAELPESPQLFDEQDRTDRDLRFRITEIIREKLTLELNQEVPYGIAVEIEKMAEEPMDSGGTRSSSARAGSASSGSAVPRVATSSRYSVSVATSSCGSRFARTGRTMPRHCARSGSSECRPAVVASNSRRCTCCTIAPGVIRVGCSRCLRASMAA